MKWKKPTYKRILFYVLLLLLFLPILQKQFKIFKPKPLKGYIEKMEPAELTDSTWFSGEYQAHQQKYIEENIGLKPLFVRINNQREYSFFNDSRIWDIVIGKEGFIYTRGYVDAYYGNDTISRDSIFTKVKMLDMISDTLRKKGTELIVMIAPGKGSYYPEYLPDEFIPTEWEPMPNYRNYVEALNGTDINFLDFNRWFREMKDTAKYPLYPKTGVHWSTFGEFRALDSLVNYISYINNCNGPDFRLNEDGIGYGKKVNEGDQDAEYTMNLIFDIPDFKMAYPGFYYAKDSTTCIPKMLTISDSYFTGIFYYYRFLSEGFDDADFWYYFDEIHTLEQNDTVSVAELDLIPEIEKNDAIILLCTDGNLNRLGFGFVERAYKEYFLNDNSTETSTGGE